ncbi:MAG TPA: NnrS family protein [Noviherbaspirillum sp.]|uniref:NnrS family protein n=1 Tax=Noviherbaspirillum sp. TaxID=1926288 RepID=UPI002B46845C|nr:NnrS family protein [Noviherbaspirillum sp.]HJV85090.1 NnrS family protein [Noviherbaspirillum sp.]
MALLTIEEPRSSAQGKPSLTHHPLFRLGFRPFYLLAAIFAGVSVPMWVATYFGVAPQHLASHVSLFWHVHEMVYGFAVAVIIGFLFTAGRNWTGLWTPRRGHLAALAGVWIAGRIAMCAFPAPLAAVVDIAFLPLAAWPMYSVLKRAGSKRNYFLVGLLGLLTAANIVFHLAVNGVLNISPIAPVEAAILVVVMIESVIGGRVIPGFTSNAVPGSKPVTNVQRDRISIGLTAVAALAWIAHLPGPMVAALTFAASVTQLTRLIGWKPHLSLGTPLLWILHVSFAWIGIGFFLLSLAALNLTTTSAAFHALAVGSIGGLIIGMITRTALGHTGRPLAAGRSELVMYLLVQAGVVTRLLAAVDAFGARNALLVIAAVCWSGAFLLYAAVYGPYLVRARIDGRDG